VGLVLFASCTLFEDNPVGFDIGGGSEGWQPVTLPPVSPEAWDGHRTTARAGGTTVMWIGSGRGYVARGLLRFGVSDTTVIEVHEARLQLERPVATDSSGGIFGLYQLLTPWTESTVGWEMAQGDSTPWETPGGDYDSLSPVAMDTLQASTEDTALCFQLDPSLIESYLLGDEEEYGFLIRIVDEAESTFVRFGTREAGFGGELTYSFSATQDDSVVLDTLTVDVSEDAYIVAHSYELPDSTLPIGSGVGYRSFLRFPLPQQLDSTWTVNRARLVVHPDTTTFFTTGSLARIQAYRITGEWAGTETELDSWVFGTATLGTGTVEDSLEVTTLVKGWVRGVYDNEGLALRAENLVFNIGFVLLHTPAEADTSLWPYLEISATPPAFEGLVGPAKPSGTECARD
jgi:hypothetical protein